jgi:hypothetical protein
LALEASGTKVNTLPAWIDAKICKVHQSVLKWDFELGGRSVVRTTEVRTVKN